VGALRQPVDDLALALVAPLGADDHYIGHYSSLRSRMCRPARQTATFHASIATRSAWRDPSLPLWRAAGPTISGLRILYLLPGPASPCAVRTGRSTHASKGLHLPAGDHAVLGRQRRRRQAGRRPCVAHAAFGCA